MNKFIKWIKNFLYQDIVIVKNNKNSKIIVNGKIIFDDTKTTNFKGWFTANNQVNNYNKDE